MDKIELISDPIFNSLLETFDKLMLEVADRLIYPNAGMLGLGKGGAPDANCLKRLANLGLAIQQRNMLMSKGLADVLYDIPATFEAATKTINSVWTTMKTSAIDKGVAIDSAVPLNSATYGTTNATMAKDMRLTFLIHALEGINALTSSPGCTGHLRLGHFATNVIGGQKGKLGLEKFKSAAKQWIRDYPKEEDVRRLVQQVGEETALSVIERTPAPPGVTRDPTVLRAAMTNALRGPSATTNTVNVGALQARLAAFKRGGYRKSRLRRSRRKHHRKTKRRHHH